MTNNQNYCLRWNNYQCNMTSVFHQLLLDESFVDVTLACNEASLKAHKVVLSACSPFFQKLLLDNPCKHPVIILPQDVKYQDLKCIIEFVYKGEIDVSHNQLQNLIKTADQLKIKGLCEVSEKEKGREITSIPLHRKRVLRYRLSHFHRRKAMDPLRRSLARVTRCRVTKPSSRPVLTQLEPMAVSVPSSLPPPPPPPPPPLSPSQPHPLILPPLPLPPIAPPQPFLSPVPVDKAGQMPSEVDVVYCNTGGRSAWSPTSTTNCSEKRPCYDDPVIVKAEEALAMFSHPQVTPIEERNGSLPDLPGNLPPDTLKNEHHSEHHDERDVTQSSIFVSDGEMNSLKSFEEDSSAMTVTPELPSIMPSSSLHNSVPVTTSLGLCPTSSGMEITGCTLSPLVDSLEMSQRWSKTWTQQDMDMALEALRTHSLSLTKASAMYGIPSTTLWQRAHRLGIDTPKKEGPGKTWTEEHLNHALDALRTGKLSANRASKEYGIPSSTLYKIARKEGIRLAAPFNAAPTTWSSGDLRRALDAIRSGMSVQRAAAEFGIPSGTLYGRCKREGIELQKSAAVPWSEEDMNNALDAVRAGDMSINQAAIHFNLPYSSLYGRVKRVKAEVLDLVDAHDGLDFVAAFQS